MGGMTMAFGAMRSVSAPAAMPRVTASFAALLDLSLFTATISLIFSVCRSIINGGRPVDQRKLCTTIFLFGAFCAVVFCEPGYHILPAREPPFAGVTLCF